MFVELHLPFPPSDNNYYVKTKQGQFISEKGRKFRDMVTDCIKEQFPHHSPIDYRMLVEVVLHVPDKRIRDILNYQKALMDALSKAEVWQDDVLIDQAVVYRGSQCFGGKTIILIHEAGPIQSIGKFMSMIPG